MANKQISKINLGGAIYSLKDNEARQAVETLQTAVASSLIFKGVISSAAEITGLTNYKTGWTYKVGGSAIFEIASLGTVEPGDMIICISDYDNSYSPSDWTIVQNNVDLMIGASISKDGTRGLVPAPTKNDTGNFLKGDGTWGSPSTDITWGTFSELIG